MDLVIGNRWFIGVGLRLRMPWSVFEIEKAVVGSLALRILCANDMALRYVRIVEYDKLVLARCTKNRHIWLMSAGIVGVARR